MSKYLEGSDWSSPEGAANQAEGDVLDAFELVDKRSPWKVFAIPKNRGPSDNRKNACLVQSS